MKRLASLGSTGSIGCSALAVVAGHRDRLQVVALAAAAEADSDGSTLVHFSPTQPDGVARGNWIQTDPERGWFVILRLYSPLQSFFDKTWRPGEIELAT